MKFLSAVMPLQMFLSAQLPQITFLQEVTSTSHLRLDDILNKTARSIYIVYASQAQPVPKRLFFGFLL